MASSKNTPILRLECKKYTLFLTNMAKSAQIDTQLMTKTAKNHTLRAAHTYIAHMREYSPPPPPAGISCGLLVVNDYSPKYDTRYNFSCVSDSFI